MERKERFTGKGTRNTGRGAWRADQKSGLFSGKARGLSLTQLTNMFFMSFKKLIMHSDLRTFIYRLRCPYTPFFFNFNFCCCFCYHCLHLQTPTIVLMTKNWMIRCSGRFWWKKLSRNLRDPKEQSEYLACISILILVLSALWF